MTRGSDERHLARAGLESIAYQVEDVIRAMEEEAGQELSELRVDGGAAENDFLCQFQSDISSIPVLRTEYLSRPPLEPHTVPVLPWGSGKIWTS